MARAGAVHFTEHDRGNAEPAARRSCWHDPCNKSKRSFGNQQPELTETTMHTTQSAVPAPKVFIVDNDPATRESLTWLLESANLTVAAFATAEAFLAACTPDQPGCLVLDLRLP